MSGAARPESAGAARGPQVVFIGPPGAGKSTVGALVAQLLGLPLVDTDALVEQVEGRTIPEIFVDSGEAYFRELERAATARALTGDPAVVSLGGGAILHEQTQAALAGHHVVFLDVSLRDASRRSGFDQGRPLLALNPRGQWLALMERRRPLYESLAVVRVDTDGRTPEQIAHEVAALLTGLGVTVATPAPTDGPSATQEQR